MSTSTLPDQIKHETEKTTPSTSNVGSVAPAGLLPSVRLNPRQIAVKLLPLEGGQSVSVLDATDEQFETFMVAAGFPTKVGSVPEWSFDNRCRAVNHALKYGLKLPFAENDNRSDQEQNQLSNNSQTIPVIPDDAASQAEEETSVPSG